MAAFGAMEAREPGVQVAAVEEGGDGGGGLHRQAGEFCGVIVDDLPNGGGAGLAGAVAGADHPVSG